MSVKTKSQSRLRRRRRVRAKVRGTADRPRLSVFRSNRGIQAQVIDDVAGVTVASASQHLTKLRLAGIVVSKQERVTERTRLARVMSRSLAAKAG